MLESTEAVGLLVLVALGEVSLKPPVDLADPGGPLAAEAAFRLLVGFSSLGRFDLSSSLSWALFFLFEPALLPVEGAGDGARGSSERTSRGIDGCRKPGGGRPLLGSPSRSSNRLSSLGS